MSGSIWAAPSTARRSQRQTWRASPVSISIPAGGSPSRRLARRSRIPPARRPGRAIMAAAAPHGSRRRATPPDVRRRSRQTSRRIRPEASGLAGDLVSIDGVALQDLDFVDVGSRSRCRRGARGVQVAAVLLGPSFFLCAADVTGISSAGSPLFLRQSFPPCHRRACPGDPAWGGRPRPMFGAAGRSPP